MKRRLVPILLLALALLHACKPNAAPAEGEGARPLTADDSNEAEPSASAAEAPVDDDAPPTTAPEDEFPPPPVEEDQGPMDTAFDIPTDPELRAVLGLTEVPPYYIDDLMTGEVLANFFGNVIVPERRPVPGLTATPWHNGVRFFYSDDRVGVILEIWHYPSELALEFGFTQLKDTNIPEPRRVDIGDDGFYAGEGSRTRVVTKDLRSLNVIAITCDERHCHVPMVLALLRHVIAQLHENR